MRVFIACMALKELWRLVPLKTPLSFFLNIPHYVLDYYEKYMGQQGEGPLIVDV